MHAPPCTLHILYTRLLLNCLAQAGVDLASLYGRDRVDMLMARDRSERRPLAEWDEMMDLADAHIGAHEDIALKMAAFIKPMDTGPIGFITMACANVRQAAEALSQFYSLLNNVYALNVTLMGDRLLTSLHPLTPARSVWLERLTLGTICWHNRWLSRREDLRFDASFQFAPPPPVHRHQYEQTFVGELTFDSDQTVLYRAPGTHLLKVSHGDHGVQESIRAQLMNELQALDAADNSLPYKLERFIKANLGIAETRIEDAAQHLGMSPRSLQTRLADFGLSYSALLDRTRHAVCLHHIGDKRTALQDLAGMLGFSTQSSFNRAFQRWTHMSPGEYRKRRLKMAPLAQAVPHPDQ